MTRAENPSSLSVIDFYWYSARLGLRSLVTNIELFRSVEYGWFLDRLGPVAGKVAFDYGCWTSYLPSYLAAKGARVVTLDFWDGARLQQRRRRRREPQRPGAWINLAGGPSSARALPLGAGSVDVAYAISSLDHVPGDGDETVFGELLRVTRPGGLLFITLPYGRRYREDRFGPWLQKSYDQTSIRERFLSQVSPEDRIELLFFGDDRSRSWTRVYWKLPWVARIATRRLQLPVARRLLKRDAASATDASLIGIAVERGNAAW